MAAIKSYSDLQQSKKLAEILPLESADMMYHSVENEYGTGAFVATSKVITNGFKNDDFYIDDIPCWSLAALLGVIKKCGLIDLRFLSSTFDGRGNHLTNVWCCTFEDIGTVTLNLYADNPIDACYEMIIKLHELNLL